MAQLFAARGATYRLLRPTYPASLYEHLWKVLDDAGIDAAKRQHAVDLCTGSGQAAVRLAEEFQTVAGVDAVQEQLDNAVKHEAVTYSAASAMDTGLPADSAQLVTCAAALHWLDVDGAYKEAARILQEGGIYAAWSYTALFSFADDARAAEATRLLHTFYWGTQAAHNHAGLLPVEDHYYGLEAPAGAPFRQLPRWDSSLKLRGSLKQFISGYMSSLSSGPAFFAARPDAPQLYEQLEEKVAAALGVGVEEEEAVTARWPLFMLLAQKTS